MSITFEFRHGARVALLVGDGRDARLHADRVGVVVGLSTRPAPHMEPAENYLVKFAGIAQPYSFTRSQLKPVAS